MRDNEIVIGEVTIKCCLKLYIQALLRCVEIATSRLKNVSKSLILISVKVSVSSLDLRKGPDFTICSDCSASSRKERFNVDRLKCLSDILVYISTFMSTFAVINNHSISIMFLQPNFL